jgi:hypothetical protein
MSIQFGVVLIIFLMVTMMFATQFEVSTSTRAMKRFIYGSKWFDLAVLLFVVNIIVNTLRRRPYRFRHAGFLTVHCGVLTIVAGGLLTRYRGVDGSMPIPEGAAAREISLPENDLVVEASGRVARHVTHYDLSPWETEPGDVFAVPGTGYHVRVDRYYPTGALADTLVDDLENGVPTLRLAVGLPGHDPIAEWLRLGEPGRDRLVHGDTRVTLVEAARADSLRAAWASSPPASRSAGRLKIFWRDGASETLDVPVDASLPLATSRRGVQVQVVRVFQSFVLVEGGATDASDQPDNPAVRFRIVGSPSGSEEHLAFTKFPEFRAEPLEGETWLVTRGEWQPGADAAGAPREVLVAHEGPGRWVAWTSWKDPADGAELALDRTVALDGGRLSLRILAESERGVLSRVVVKTSEEVERPVLLLALVERTQEGGPAGLAAALGLGAGTRRAPIDPNEVWLFHGESFRFETPQGPVDVSYSTRSIPLDFAIHLDDFREETYPGVSLAASFESHVTVHPAAGEPFQEKIYMNHPLKYAGYTFYQASFQRTPQGEVTILSVARDPGMQLSFVGYCVLVAGLLLIFFAKPHLRRLDDRMAARVRTAGG